VTVPLLHSATDEGGIHMGTGIIGTIVSLVVGGAVATVTVVGVVGSQTSAPNESPVDSSQPASQIVQYGSN